MPSSVDMHFQSSLRGTGGGHKSPAVKLHRGCSGTLHGHGVDKVKSKVVPSPCQRTCHSAANNTTATGHDHQDGHGEEPAGRRKISMLGLGSVLPVQSKGLPPRSPPKFLTYSSRSLSSSSGCSSASSSRYSSASSPSPGVQDQYNSPLTWPAPLASGGYYLEGVDEEDDSDEVHDSGVMSAEWTDRTSPSSSSTLASSFGANSPADHGPPPKHHSTPVTSRLLTADKNRPSQSQK